MKKYTFVFLMIIFAAAVYSKDAPQIDFFSSDNEKATVTGTVESEGLNWFLKLDKPLTVNRVKVRSLSYQTSRLLLLASNFDFSREWEGKKVTLTGRVYYFDLENNRQALILVSGLKSIKGYPPSIAAGPVYTDGQEAVLSGTIRYYPFHDAPKSDHSTTAEIDYGSEKRKGGSLSWRLHNPGYLLYKGQPKAIGVYELVTAEGAQDFAIFGNDADGQAALKSALENPKNGELTLEKFLKLWTGEMWTPYVLVLDKPLNFKDGNMNYGLVQLQLATIDFSLPEEWDGKHVSVKGRFFSPENNHHHTKALFQVMDESDVSFNK